MSSDSRIFPNAPSIFSLSLPPSLPPYHLPFSLSPSLSYSFYPSVRNRQHKPVLSIRFSPGPLSLSQGTIQLFALKLPEFVNCATVSVLSLRTPLSVSNETLFIDRVFSHFASSPSNRMRSCEHSLSKSSHMVSIMHAPHSLCL